MSARLYVKEVKTCNECENGDYVDGVFVCFNSEDKDGNNKIIEVTDHSNIRIPPWCELKKIKSKKKKRKKK